MRVLQTDEYEGYNPESFTTAKTGDLGRGLTCTLIQLGGG